MDSQYSPLIKQQLCEHLQQFITLERVRRMRAVLENRTRYITVILEDIYQPHNASAVLRSCECYGVQDVYSIEDRNLFEISTGVTRKAHQWLTVHKFHKGNGGTAGCLSEIQEKGFKLAVMTPDADMLLEDVPLDKPLAFLFGTEKEGISEEASQKADFKLKIPMYGFSESLNVSVSVALTLYQTMQRLRREKEISEICLRDAEKEELWYQWLSKSVKGSAAIEQRFLASQGILAKSNNTK